jgi:DNA polymerase-3 subunit delta'
MGFKEFFGNERIAAALRSMLAHERVPHALLFAGPRGVGKYTLARIFAQAANCERLRDDACGECASCLRLAAMADPTPLIERGLAERGEGADAATVERTPLIIETHPDVWLLVPDPVRQRTPVARPLLRLGQLRAVQRAAQFAPSHRRRVFLLDGAETMRWTDADAFLKILEEPPETATLILLTTNAEALLPTIRSRCLQFSFAPLATEAVERLLKERTKLAPAARRLAAQLSGGCPGVALSLDLAEHGRLRREILRFLETAAAGRDFSGLFSLSSALSKNESESFENILVMFYSVLSDVLVFTCGSRNPVLRNPDLRGEIEALSAKVHRDWVVRAVQHLDELHGRLRRNSNRQLGLDAVAASLSRS